MDYNILVGLHLKEPNIDADLIPSGARTPTANGDSDTDSVPHLSRADMDRLLLDPVGSKSLILYGGREICRNSSLFTRFKLLSPFTGEWRYAEPGENKVGSGGRSSKGG